MSVLKKDTRVGFVGIGNMGQPMTKHLVEAGWDVALYDADPARLAQVAGEHGCATAGSLEELGRRSDVVILMLPDGKIVRRVAVGGDGGGDHLLLGMAPGSTIIDMSSSAPVGTRELGEALARHQVSLLDAPVSGGVKGAVAGTLAIMVGGHRDLAERFDPLLSAMGRRFHVGPLGSGHAAKVLNNYVSAAGLAAAAEALLIAERFGIEGEVLVDVLNASTGRNNSTENKFKQYVLNQAYNSGFALDLMVKDLQLAMEVAEACGVEASLGHSCTTLWKEAQSWVGRNADHTEFARFIIESAEDANEPASAKAGPR
ncbi:2-hydroxy-3-oxopropionate reductase [Agaricicola taiwanensis]|uniref:2-hydroxy-3-oxopropionate reductase n=1 Tax=Agaricicola taiwanensis TaxID=591372 RepID=A0A8J2YLL3_9RHOB|nr:NAD(P)-dependent oxidoreductase [Agaricicola taiwanensis]GGE51574.1 2-hydroxy-3-oxopropionate reductase [Agaricicola taiwanensis]